MLADELSELARQVEDLKNRAAARQLKKKERKFQPIAGTSPGPEHRRSGDVLGKIDLLLQDLPLDPQTRSEVLHYIQSKISSTSLASRPASPARAPRTSPLSRMSPSPPAAVVPMDAFRDRHAAAVSSSRPLSPSRAIQSSESPLPVMPASVPAKTVPGFDRTTPSASPAAAAADARSKYLIPSFLDSQPRTAFQLLDSQPKTAFDPPKPGFQLGIASSVAPSPSAPISPSPQSPRGERSAPQASTPPTPIPASTSRDAGKLPTVSSVSSSSLSSSSSSSSSTPQSISPREKHDIHSGKLAPVSVSPHSSSSSSSSNLGKDKDFKPAYPSPLSTSPQNPSPISASPTNKTISSSTAFLPSTSPVRAPQKPLEERKERQDLSISAYRTPERRNSLSSTAPALSVAASAACSTTQTQSTHFADATSSAASDSSHTHSHSHSNVTGRTSHQGRANVHATASASLSHPLASPLHTSAPLVLSSAPTHPSLIASSVPSLSASHPDLAVAIPFSTTDKKATLHSSSSENDPLLCPGCKRSLDAPNGGELIEVSDRKWHPQCFVCASCRRGLVSDYMEKDNLPYCISCYTRMFAQPCSACKSTVLGRGIRAGEKIWHVECFVCSICLQPLGENFYHLNGSGALCCQQCKLQRRSTKH